MPFKKGEQQTDIRDTETLHDFWDGEPPRPDTIIVNKFMQRIRSLHAVLKRYFIDPGEALIMIHRNLNGWTWDTIPYGQFEEVEHFFHCNAFRKIEILTPERHMLLMNYTPEKDFYLLEVEKYCPGMLAKFLTGWRHHGNEYKTRYLSKITDEEQPCNQ